MGEIGCGLCATQGKQLLFTLLLLFKNMSETGEDMVLFRALVKVINQARVNG